MPGIAVVGSYAVGLVMTTMRVPRPGETVLGDTFEETHGGKGSNQAVASSRLGADTSFIARVGKDHYGKDAIELHKSEGVNDEFLAKTQNYSTGAGFIIVGQDGENSIVVTPGANSSLDEDYIDSAAENIKEADVMLTQLEIPLQTALHAGKLASENGVYSILNPAPAPSTEIEREKLSRFDLITPNYIEACALAGIDPNENPTAESLLDRLVSNVSSAILMTLGAEGALLKTEESSIKVDGFEVETIDTTGAGDVFNAALAVALSEGKRLENGEAIEFACAAGALAITKQNVIPSIPKRDEVEDFLSKHN